METRKITLRLAGKKENQEETALPKTASGEIKKLIGKGRVRLGAAREAGGVAELKNVRADDVACVEFSNGFKHWTRVDDLYREYGARTSRGAVEMETAVWEIDPRVRREAVQRGAAGVAVEALEIFGVDLKGKAADALAVWFEQRQLDGRDPGLYRFSLGDSLTLEPVGGGALPTETRPRSGPPEPLLIFLHGTASSTQRSFRKLWLNNNRAGQAGREKLKDIYGERVYALEHLSLSTSPIDNALLLAKSLPEKAELHLVSHSRGGLIGELLCLGQRHRSPDPLTADFLDKLFEKDRTEGEMLGLGKHEAKGYPDQREKLRELLDLLDEKCFKVSRFVRVACPARGTTFASGRLDRWLSVFHFLAAETPADDAVDFLLGVVKKRTDPRSLPGLEAMMPGSALVRLLNHVDLEVDSDLSVIAGDIEGDSIWSRLKLLIADWFYGSDHDLVVNTGSMYGGAQRPPKGARFVFDRGKDVNHFSYFANEKTVDFMVAGLTRAECAMAGFQPIEAARHDEPRWRAAVARSAQLGPRPLAVVLPGIMGSALAQDKDRIWVDRTDLARGRVAELGIKVPNVVSEELLDDFYGEFLEYLSRSHEVVPFHYDWRKSVLENADQLAAGLEVKLPACESTKQPVRIVAHSMGGLVARAMIARRPDVWNRIRALADSRFLMLGTPNCGSYETVRWLTGWNPTLGKLSLLDLFHDTRDVVRIVNRFPGLLELLPADEAARNFSGLGFWRQLCENAPDWPLPLESDLGTIHRTWEVIRSSPVDPEFMFYVAGWAPQTICDYGEEENGRTPSGTDRPGIRFYATRRGDGTVTWESGLLPGVKTWYVEEAAHDELLTHEPAFPAYLDLLQSGTTTRLPRTEPGPSRAASLAEDRSVMPPMLPDSLPSEGDLSGFTFSGRRPREGAKRRRLPRITVSIRHGSLAYAHHPIGVGHYEGDTIVSAEAELDKRLEGALSKRARLGLYPGPLGSHEIFIHRDRNAKPGGAVVVGLGRVGELTPGTLETGVARAMLDYALTVADWLDDRFGREGSPRSARLSFLLIGTGFGAISVRDSIESILRGVNVANQRLVETRFDDKVLIEEIEFLELYQDVAISAARALDRILLDGELEQHFQWTEHVVQEGVGGMRRVLFEDPPNWWHRLEIIHDKIRGDLRFIALTDRARAEETLVSGQLRLADQFIHEAITTTSHSRHLAQTLFEMLLPNRLKQLAPNQYDVVLLVDPVSAAYPWELLEDRWTVGGKPIAVAAGMLRQLKTLSFRAQPAHTFENAAYVVGNPKLPANEEGVRFPDLPGATKEAENVARLLRQNGYRVNDRQTHLEASEILIGLHRDAYRILHLAGHGVHETEIEVQESPDEKCIECDRPLPKRTKRVSGMVIGKDIFLTAGDVEQMRWVPELVFINCCYLGSTLSKDPRLRRYNRLAANLAAQFINMGVKAVVAAGWAVDDSAADSFSQSFYRHLLSGDPFGEAVRAAREQIYEQYPHANTWGAYQCYGDPDFRLAENSRSSGKARCHYHAPIELVSELENLSSEIRMLADESGNRGEWEECIRRALERVPVTHLESGMRRADVSSALGTIYGELGEYEQAVDHLKRALEANDAEFSVKALEQRASYRIKNAHRQWQAAGADQKAKIAASASVQIEAAIDDLAALCRLCPTMERLCLLGGAYKRLAWISADENIVVEALVNMASNYKQGYDLPSKEEKLAAMPLANWTYAEAILAWHGKRYSKEWKNLIPMLCSKEIEEAGIRESEFADFWSSVAQADCRLALSVAKGGVSAEEKQRITDGYRHAFARGASPGDRSVVRENLDFLIHMADRKHQDGLKRDLQDIRGRLD